MRLIVNEYRRLPRRARLASFHLAASAAVAAVSGLIVFLLWFPKPFAELAGGLALFALLVCVDMVLGPALTALVAGAAKPRRELCRDLCVILLLQLAAFGYGMHAMWLARPVCIAFEVDRMRVLTAADIEPASLKDAPPELRHLPWRGPQLLAAVVPTDPADMMRSLDLELAGIALSMRPANWRSYAAQRDVAWRAAQPVAALLKRYPQARAPLATLAADVGVEASALRFMPLQSRHATWAVVVAAPGARIVGYLPFDGFL